MIQAGQKAVVQEANINLINIRSAEIQYFANFFLNFATQASVLAGVIMGALSQTPGIGADTGYFWLFIYNVGSALVVALSIQSLLTAVFVAVYGEGYALRGPLGSMVKTVEGMVHEQEQIVYTFVVNIFVFVVMQEVGMFFIVMDTTNAIVSSVFICVFLIYTYHHALRIYNRFYWDKATLAWDDELEQDPENALKELNPNIESKPNDTLKAGLLDNKPKKPSMISSVLPRRKKGSAYSDKNSEVTDGSYMNPIHTEPRNTNEIFKSDFIDVSHIEKVAEIGEKSVGGFMTLKTNKRFTSDPWERRFFLVHKQLIHYYKDKQACLKDKGNPINRRPIDLEGYCLIAETIEPPYQITLVPLDPDDARKTWKFRCDTGAEFHKWVEVLSESIQSSNGGSVRDELIKLPPNF